MGVVTCQISISLDGSVAGPNQSIENPIGEDGMRLLDWVFATASWRRQHGQDGAEDGADSDVAEEVTRGSAHTSWTARCSAAGQGSGDQEWKGWRGDEPSYHSPVFVLTSHPRQPPFEAARCLL
jgi:hypothetical protein